MHQKYPRGFGRILDCVMQSRYLTLHGVRYLKEWCMELGTFLELVMAIIATEATTNLITKSEFSIRFIKKPLFNLRQYKIFSFIHDILDCGYCTSVWAACLFALFITTDMFSFIILILVLHRMSNLLHFIIDWFDEKRPRDLNFNSKGEDYERLLLKEHDTPVVSHDEKSSGAGTNDSSGRAL